MKVWELSFFLLKLELFFGGFSFYTPIDYLQVCEDN